MMPLFRENASNIAGLGYPKKGGLGRKACVLHC
jgi:hypothetical protein